MLRAAGRTDTGVHATGQVAHLDVPAEALGPRLPASPRDGEPEFLPLVRRLARFLPADVRVRDIARAPAGFDARFSALRRHYVYRLSTAPYGVDPQQARFVTPWPRPRRRRDGGGVAAHCWACTTSPRSAGTATVPPPSANCSGSTGSRDGDAITAYVTADAFCWNMVRSLVGALLAVGEGRREPGLAGRSADRARRSSAFAAAPARGLTLVGVDYPPDDQLAGAHPGDPRRAHPATARACPPRNRQPG